MAVSASAGSVLLTLDISITTFSSLFRKEGWRFSLANPENHSEPIKEKK
jgi:hypothetical protein